MGVLTGIGGEVLHGEPDDRTKTHHASTSAEIGAPGTSDAVSGPQKEPGSLLRRHGKNQRNVPHPETVPR